MCVNKKNSLLHFDNCVVSREDKIAMVNAELSYKIMPKVKFYFRFNKCAVAYCTTLLFR